jgi:hypothetical protein
MSSGGVWAATYKGFEIWFNDPWYYVLGFSTIFYELYAAEVFIDNLPLGNVVFTVYDSASQTLIDLAHVILGSFSTDTDINGVAALTVPSGEYVCNITKEGYSPYYEPHFVVDSNIKMAVPIPLTPTNDNPVTVMFAVQDSKTLLPVELAEVSLGNMVGYTGSNGSVNFVVTPGIYVCIVTKNGYQTLNVSKALTTNATIVLALDLKGGGAFNWTWIIVGISVAGVGVVGYYLWKRRKQHRALPMGNA